MTLNSLQDTFSPDGICFGCGCSNNQGLQIKSFVKGDSVVCEWMGKKHHQAFPGMLNGGIIGSVLDCHCNWTAAYFLMKNLKDDTPPCTVTAEYSIKLHRPTPINEILSITANLSEIQGNRARVEASLYCKDKLCASCSGLFVAVEEGHPAYHRW